MSFPGAELAFNEFCGFPGPKNCCKFRRDTFRGILNFDVFSIIDKNDVIPSEERSILVFFIGFSEIGSNWAKMSQNHQTH